MVCDSVACFFYARADVAGSDTEGQGRRPRRGADVRLLERSRAIPWTGTHELFMEMLAFPSPPLPSSSVLDVVPDCAVLLRGEV
jgi:hypothetical protein